MLAFTAVYAYNLNEGQALVNQFCVANLRLI
jgi:hypothetical protein